MSQNNEACQEHGYQLCYELKQHSPLIHFQADEEGATLREQPVKAMFDEFLKKYAFDNDKNRYRHLLKDDMAFDYSIEIKSKELPEIFEINNKIRNRNGGTVPLPFPGYFASADRNWDKKAKNIKFVQYKQLTLHIVVFIEELKKAIDDNIANFFFTHNFGHRSSKGFGSFTVSDKECSIADNAYYYDVEINEKIEKKIFVNKPQRIYGEYYNLFDNINLFYKTLRSGINIGNFYFKSLLFLYARDVLKTQWDKKTIKEEFLPPSYRNKQTIKHKNSDCKDVLTFQSEGEPYLLRDHLGLSTIQEYKKPSDNFYRNSAEEFTVRHPKNNPLDEYEQKSIPANNMERLQSPLLIKIYKLKERYRIFIVPKEYPEYILDENITLLKVKKINQEEVVTGIIEDIKLHPGFNFKEYLDFAFSQNIPDHLEKCGTSNKNYFSKTIISIYRQLNKQALKKRINHD